MSPHVSLVWDMRGEGKAQVVRFRCGLLTSKDQCW